MRDIRGLVARALKDMELAKRYRQRKEYAATTLLYNKAIERVLKALFISKKRKDPPIGASAVYMASNMRMPEEIMTGLLSLHEIGRRGRMERKRGGHNDLRADRQEHEGGAQSSSRWTSSPRGS